MTDYIVLLSDEAEKWMFSLAYIFFQALMPAMQAVMTTKKFVMLPTARSHTKADQVAVLNEVRSHATQSNKKGFLNHNAINEQVEVLFASSGILSSASVHHTSINNTLAGYNYFTRDPSSHTLADAVINTYLYGNGGHVWNVNHNSPNDIRVYTYHL